MKVLQNKILIATEQKFIENNIQDIAYEMGYNIILFAKSDIEVMQIYKKYKPEIIIIDASIPFNGCLGVIEKLKFLDPFIKIVVTATLENAETVKRALLKGAQFYIFTPFRKKEFMQILKLITKNALNIKDFLLDKTDVKLHSNIKIKNSDKTKSSNDDYKKLSKDFFSFLKGLQKKIKETHVE